MSYSLGWHCWAKFLKGTWWFYYADFLFYSKSVCVCVRVCVPVGYDSLSLTSPCFLSLIIISLSQFFTFFSLWTLLFLHTIWHSSLYSFTFFPLFRFDSVSDLLEPVSDGLKNHCFISKSYDATSHFETAANDVLSLYERITGDYIAWVIYITTISNSSN